MTKIAAIPLYQFFNRNGDCRFTSKDAVTNFFKLDHRCEIVLTGVGQDKEVERWWGLGARDRVKAIKNLRRIGIGLVTTPNFSVIVDRPRTDDLHAIKRIVEVYCEFVAEGLPAALHVNGRTDRDFERWAEFIIQHPEITHLAYEFTTGTKYLSRMNVHKNWLASVANSVGRRLNLIIRGGSQIASELSSSFDVSLIDSSAFEKAIHRQVLKIDVAGNRRWQQLSTAQGEPVDQLLVQNTVVSSRWVENLVKRLPIAA